MQTTAQRYAKVKQVHSNETRICFGREHDSIHYKKLSVDSDSDEYELGCYPNYEIKQDKIDISSVLPETQPLPEISFKLFCELDPQWLEKNEKIFNFQA